MTGSTYVPIEVVEQILNSHGMDIQAKRRLVEGSKVVIDDKAILGGTWILLHFLAEFVDRNTEGRPFFISFFKWLSNNFWCEECAPHFKDYANKKPIENNFFFGTYLFIFHNAVNKRIGKPEMSIEDYHAFYRNKLNKDGKSNCVGCKSKSI